MSKGTSPAVPATGSGGLPPVTPILPGGGGEGGGNSGPGRGNARQTSMLGIGIGICASTMTFAALVSAMVVRRGLGSDWHHTPVPAVLWWNTGLLLASSVIFDIARRLLRSNRRIAFNRMWTLGTVMGTLFWIGQCVAWGQLSIHGFYMRGNPSSAFFYVLTWTHAAHVIGTLLPVYYVEYKALRFQLSPVRRTTVEVSTVFWHFLDIMWLALMALFVWWA